MTNNIRESQLIYCIGGFVLVPVVRDWSAKSLLAHRVRVSGSGSELKLINVNHPEMVKLIAKFLEMIGDKQWLKDGEVMLILNI